MSDYYLSYLSQVHDRLLEIEREHVFRVGREKAFHFVELANDWIDISIAIGNTYATGDLSQSLVHSHFLSLFKEVQWFQLHFLSGNYPLLGRSLRFVWELMFRAYYVDTYLGEFPPGPSPR